ncbi:hypothetical protein [Thorsellia kenyensis]|uniref:Uncharacterized protein n=1 Tax=Thorsellia kenyensis TaxID=1549888 RepID=A0ABV6C6I3_9GAMM
MNLRETIRNLSKEDKQAVYATLTRNERLHAVAQNSDSTIYAYEIQPMSIIYFRDDKWVNYVSFEVIGNAALATDHATTILKREEVFELLKVEEYKLDNLPKNGWYVELPENKDDIDLDKLNKALNKEYEFYHENGVDKICKYYGVISDTCLRCTDYFEYVKNLENVTHLFLKQPEYTLDNLPEKWFVEISGDVDSDLVEKTISKHIRPDAHRPCTLSIKELTVNNIVYGVRGENWSWSSKDDYSKEDGFINLTHLFLKKKEEEMEIIEINGKKYRKIDTQGKFENGDIIISRTDSNAHGRFIGYNYSSAVILSDTYKEVLPSSYLKLEEIKTKTYYYAIYRDEDELYHSNFYSYENLLKKDCPDALEYRSFEEQL